MFKVRCKLKVLSESMVTRFDDNLVEVKCREIDNGNNVSIYFDREAEHIDEVYNLQEDDVIGVGGTLVVSSSQGKNGKNYVNVNIKNVTDFKVLGQMRFEY